MASKVDTGISDAQYLVPSADIRLTVDELWTARNDRCTLHYAVSYRASFSQTPDFFIRRYFAGDVVLDPFRTRYHLQANLLGRAGWGNDVNPLSVLITHAKHIP